MGADEAGATGDEGLPDHGGEGYRSMVETELARMTKK
jgi:hypothetical protein